MKKLASLIFLNFIISLPVFAQKIDTDSLLVQASYQLNTLKDYQKAIQLAHIGIKKAPDYLDFQLVLGRAFERTQEIDSARIYFNWVIDKNPKYKEAFQYLAKLEIEQKNIVNANRTIDKAILYYPEEADFYLLKLQSINLENNTEKSISYLTELVKKYPSNISVRQQLTALKSKTDSDRVGITHNYTTFSRQGIGPWHLLGIHYIRERKLLTVIGRVNFADRRSEGRSLTSGVQYELETYFKNNKKSYSYVNFGYSKDIIFPKIRFSYSYFHNFTKGWETDLGIRYTKTNDTDFYAAVLGLGKYVGSSWLNLKSYAQIDKNTVYPAFTATARYYFDTKYDYATLIGGYGTSPDERTTLGQFQQRIALDSYRVGAGYYKLFWEHYCTGLQVIGNRQEYSTGHFQNEVDLFISIQYKF